MKQVNSIPIQAKLQEGCEGNFSSYFGFAQQ
jgi:hypothetical protein